MATPPSKTPAASAAATDEGAGAPFAGATLPATLAEAWRHASAQIGRLDARLLVEHVADCSHTALIADPQRPLPVAAAERLLRLIARRQGGEPLAYLTGQTGFYGLEFAVSPAVLIPRPDTELLVDLARTLAAGGDLLAQASSVNASAQPADGSLGAALASVAGPVPSAAASGAVAREARPLRVLDLGTGSGAIAVALAVHLPHARVQAVDRSAAALEVARANAARHAAPVAFALGDWFSPLADECFDIVVSNPPYIAAGDVHLQQNGLPFEPPEALSDGGDGLECLRAIIAGAPAHLRNDGWLLLEHGYDQAAAVRALLTAAGFVDVASWRDLGGIERVSGGRYPRGRP
ncbi:HemK/PrmC family methyltransferase [Rhodocyclus gracilis]|uniref:HemK/PrmC family methyltransferase n=1 Tax=Rhodocyclus gracilis TaxID=2929842 RepID=UPI0030F38A29